MVAAHEAAKPSQGQPQAAPAASAIRNDSSPGSRLVAAHQRQQEGKATSGSVQASDASPSERMLVLVNRRHGS